MSKKYCSNCNRIGHIFRTCRHPINSYGLIIYHRFSDNQTRYLVIQRRYSVYYTELIRGAYGQCDGSDFKINHEYLVTLIRNLPQTERNYIQRYDFSYLWNMLWQWNGTLGDRHHLEELAKSAEAMFNYCKTGAGEINFNVLFKKYPPAQIEPEWELPKGRRRYREPDLQCAIRETQEETTLTPDHYHIYQHVAPFRQIHTGINGIKYCNSYYVGQLTRPCNLYYNPHNIVQNNEIRKIGWFTLAEIAQMSGENTHYLDILRRVDQLTHALSQTFMATDQKTQNG